MMYYIVFIIGVAFARGYSFTLTLGYLYLLLGLSYGHINPLKSHGISPFWSCDRIEKLNETYL